MNRILHHSIFTFVVAFVLCVHTARAQEPLTTILDRGYPAHWYVCGPFESDLDAGIIDALLKEQSPLGRNDFMASQGGITAIQPRNGMAILKENGEATWLRTRAESSTVDLAPFFSEVDAGIGFAAFYATTPVAQSALIEVQSALGTRVFLNGKEVSDLPPKPLSVAGVDVFQVDFQPGSNLLLVELPGASLEAMAEAFGETPEAFRLQQFSSRSQLDVNTGYEFDLRITALTSFQGISYSKTLRSTGTFSGTHKDVYQDAWLTLYNPSDKPSPSLDYTAAMPGATPRIEMVIPSIPPRTRILHRLSLPVASRIPGKPMRVDSALTINRETDIWSSTIPAGQVPQFAQHYAVVLPSLLDAAKTPQSLRTEQYRQDLAERIQRSQEVDEYGFSLGEVSQWLPVLTAYPEYRAALEPLLKSKAVSPWSTYATIDHRIVGGETLVRNLLYGDLYSSTWLDAPQRLYWGWNMPAFSPQLPQLLEDAGHIGVIHNLPYSQLPAIYKQQGRDTTSLVQRRKVNSPFPKTLLDIHDIARGQHVLAEEEGLEHDLQIYENTAHAPETFWLENNLPLSKAIPSIRVNGNGGEEYFNALEGEFAYTQRQTPWVSRDQRSFNALDILQNPVLLKRNAEAERLLLDVETWGSFAALAGAEYPFGVLNDAWKQLLHLSHPERLAQHQSTENYLDQLAQYRTLLSNTQPILDASLAHLSAQISTENPLVASIPNTQAIVVFNPSNWSRSDYVELRLELDAAEGLTILDPSGLPVPFDFKALHIVNKRLEGITVRFRSKNVPSIGYSTYYAVPEGSLTYPRELYTPYIENEFFQLAFKNGEISRITDKTQALPEIKDATFNDIVAYHLEVESNQARWTGDITRSSEQQSKVALEAFALGQRATITTPFLDGELIRRVTLLYGNPRIEFDVEFKGLEGVPALWGATFSPIHQSLTPLTGHQYGSMVGRADTTTEVFRADPEHTALPVLNTASQFHAVTVAPHIDVEGAFYEAIRPATIVHSGTATEDKLAKRLQSALIFRGVPSVTMVDTYSAPSTAWRDDTMISSMDDDLGEDTFFRVLIGHPKHNVATEELLGQFTETTRTSIEALFGQGQAVFLYDNHVPFGHAPLPTLILAGDTITETELLVDDMITAVHEEGKITLTRAQYLPTEGKRAPEWSGALLHTESALNAVQSNQWMHFFYNSLGNDESILPQSSRYHYALYPYAGTSNASNVARQAAAYSRPLLATQTTLHAGLKPRMNSLLETTGDNFILTSITPRVPEETLFGQSQPFLDAIIVRGYEAKGVGGILGLETETKVYGIAELSPTNHELTPVRTVTGALEVELTPYEVQSVALYPVPGKRSATPIKLNAQVDHTIPVFTRSWKQNSGVSTGNQQALTVRIQDPIPTPSGEVKIIVSNNSHHHSYSGELITQVSQGWKVTPDTQEFFLGPNNFISFKVTVTQQNRELIEWGIMAQVEQGGLSVIDVATNYDYPIEVSAENRDEKYLVSIRNQGGLPLIGQVELISQLDTGTLKPVPSISPSVGQIQVSPYQEQRVLFNRTTREIPAWAYAKVTANNLVRYIPIELTASETEASEQN